MDIMPRGDATPTVSRIAGDTLVELAYDPSVRKTALVVCREDRCQTVQRLMLDTGEQLVPYAPTNNLIRHRCVQLPSEPVEHGNKDALLGEIQAYLHRYVDLSPRFERMAAYYVLLSWVFDAFNELPYLRFRGDYGSGKTRALLTLGSVVYKGFFASGASTVSPIFHTLDTFGGTLILDEADLRFSDKTADLVKLLNNGTVRGLPVLRSVQGRTKEFNPAAFDVFGPKIIAMRGSFRDQALESRFLTEDMRRRELRSDVPIQLPDQLAVDALVLRNQLLHFRLTTFLRLRRGPVEPITSLDARLNQTASSWFALMDDPAARDDLVALLHARQEELDRSRADEIAERTRAAVMAAFDDPNRTQAPLQEIAMRASADSPSGMATARDIGRVLRSLDIALRKSHGTIVVPRSALTAFEARP